MLVLLLGRVHPSPIDGNWKHNINSLNYTKKLQEGNMGVGFGFMGMKNWDEI